MRYGYAGLISLWPLLIALPGPVRAAYDPYYGNSYRYNYGSGYGYGYNSYRSNGPIISLELDARKSRNADLRVAARENRTADLLHLLQEGGDVDGKSEQGETALIYAAQFCALEAAQILLDHRADPNERDIHGRTALIYAVTEGCLPMTRLFLRIPGIVLNVRDDQHLTVMDYATQSIALVLDGPPVDIFRLVKNAWDKGEGILAETGRKRRHH